MSTDLELDADRVKLDKNATHLRKMLLSSKDTVQKQTDTLAGLIGKHRVCVNWFFRSLRGKAQIRLHLQYDLKCC